MFHVTWDIISILYLGLILSRYGAKWKLCKNFNRIELGLWHRGRCWCRWEEKKIFFLNLLCLVKFLFQVFSGSSTTNLWLRLQPRGWHYFYIVKIEVTRSVSIQKAGLKEVRKRYWIKNPEFGAILSYFFLFKCFLKSNIPFACKY